MQGAFSNLSGFEIFFAICAIVGGIFVLVRFVMQVTGAGGDLDLDAQHIDADASFGLLSVHGLTSFFMMFGLVGFALYRQSQVGAPIAIVGAVAAGLASVWLIGRLFGGLLKLQSSGTQQTADAVGCEGAVYLRIPAGGTGKVMINFNNRLREYDAIHTGGEDLATGARIRVVRISGNVLVVEKLQS